MLKPYWVKLNPCIVERLRSEARRLAFQDSTDCTWAQVLRMALERGMADMGIAVNSATGGVAGRKS
jgi:hypothetical protein